MQLQEQHYYSPEEYLEIEVVSEEKKWILVWRSKKKLSHAEARRRRARGRG